MQWKILNQQVPVSQTDVKQILLDNRHITDSETFFNPPKPQDLSLAEVDMDPTALTAAIERLALAISRHEKIIVFGDYDADGISATAVMWLALHAAGATVFPFIPDRLKHGYGLSSAALVDLLANGKPDLIVTVDNGIVAHAAIKELVASGIEVIVTDHHSPEATLPPASFIVHTTKLCGTTVAWMVARELGRLLHLPDQIAVDLLDLCGIATIADQVPLLAANRSFAYWGIEALKTTSRPGIKALCQVAEMEQATISTNSIHYGLAPRINAMGRLEHGLDALRILCTTNLARAQSLAQSISLTNVKRQTLTEDLLTTALSQAQTWETEHVIVVSSTAYHEGVIGLIAGKLMETYYKPAIVIAIGETKSKASARSIAGINIVDLIRLVKDDLLEVGGHPMAAGFGLLTSKLELVTDRLQTLAREHISTESLVPALTIEAELPFSLATEKTVQTMSMFEPFGQANHRPLWGLRQLKVLTATTIGNQQQHLKLTVCPTTGTETEKVTPLTCLGWGKAGFAQDVQPGSELDIAGELETKVWKGRSSTQLILKDLNLL